MSGPVANVKSCASCNDENIHPNVGDRPINPGPVNVIVAGAGLDTYIPNTPEVKESDIESKSKVNILIPIEGRSTYKSMRILTQKMGRNAHGIQVPFGIGKRGCWELVYSSDFFSRNMSRVVSPQIRGDVSYICR